MRLIDADELKIEFEDCMFNDNMMNPLMRYTDILELIDNQPTAYDIDKVVKELEENSVIRTNSKLFYDNPQNGEYVDFVVLLSKAIEIVKGGGKDENNN